MTPGMKAIKPIADDLDETEVLYECPVCGCGFHVLGTLAQFCFRCGQQIDWEGVMLEVPEEKAELHRSQRTRIVSDVLSWINKQNKEGVDNGGSV